MVAPREDDNRPCLTDGCSAQPRSAAREESSAGSGAALALLGLVVAVKDLADALALTGELGEVAGGRLDRGVSDEDDGFGWPRSDGLKWPHFGLVDVLGSVWRMGGVEVVRSRCP